MIEKKAQSAIEFIVVLVGVMLFFGIFMIAVEVNRSDKVEENRVSMLNDVALSIKDEINLGVSASDGYSRQFFIPDNVMGSQINASINGRSIYVVTTDGKHALSQQPLAVVVGDVYVGSNIIEKINGTVYINRV